MTANLLETGWQHILQECKGFCCEYHRGMYRAIYFAGAMNAMAAATTWQPGAHDTEIHRACLNLVCDELTVESFKAELSDQTVGHA